MDFSRRFCPGDDPDEDLDANFVDTRLAAALLLDGDGSTSAKRDGVEAAELARFVAPRTRGRGVIVDVAGGLVVTGAPVDVGALLDAGAVVGGLVVAGVVVELAASTNTNSADAAAGGGAGATIEIDTTLGTSGELGLGVVPGVPGVTSFVGIVVVVLVVLEVLVVVR